MTDTVRLPVRPADGPRRGRSTRSSRQRRRRRRLIVTVVVLALLGGVVVGVRAWWKGSVGPLTVRETCTATANGTTEQLDPEQAGNAAIIAAVADKRGLPARAATIAIATAIHRRSLFRGHRDTHVDTLGPQAVDVFYLQEAHAGVLSDQRAADAAHAVRAALSGE